MTFPFLLSKNVIAAKQYGTRPGMLLLLLLSSITVATAQELPPIDAPTINQAPPLVDGKNPLVPQSTAPGALNWQQIQEAIHSGNDATKSYALRQVALLELGREPERQQILEQALKDTNPDIRRVAAYGIGKMLSGKKISLPSLNAALSDTVAPVRFRAAEALMRIGNASNSKKAICTYAELLSVPVPTEPSEKSVRAIGFLSAGAFDEYAGSNSDTIVDTLAACSNKDSIRTEIGNALNEKNLQVRSAGIKAAGLMPDLARQWVPKLLELLEKEDHPAMRSEVIYTLSDKELYSEKVSTAILTHRTQPFYEERKATYISMALLPVDRAVPLLLEGLKDSHEEVRVAVMLTLGSFGARAGSIVQLLRMTANDDQKQPRERGAAVQALELVGTPEAKLVIREIEKRAKPGKAE